MAAAVNDFYDVQAALLEAAAGALDAIPSFPGQSDLAGAPDRQGVVPPGQIVMDCEQLVVAGQSIGEMQTGPVGPTATAGKRHVFGRVNVFGVQIMVTRDCIPIGTTAGRTYTPPTMAEQAFAARQLNADGMALWCGLFIRMVDEDIDLMSRCDQVFWDAMNTVGPLGRHAGWVLNLRVRLAGYRHEPT